VEGTGPGLKRRGRPPGTNPGGRPRKMQSPLERTVALESEDWAWLDTHGGPDRLRELVKAARLEKESPTPIYPPADLIV
jgi:hypothetical protein